MSRKVITAIINGSLYIDPRDVEKVDLEEIKNKASKALKRNVTVTIAPIERWMPQSAPNALMNEAIKDLGIKNGTIKTKF